MDETTQVRRVLMITGASTGIGAQVAREAVERGWNVALLARTRARLEKLAGELGAQRALAIACDVTDWEAMQGATAQVVERFGRVDAVFANAGFGAPRGFETSTPEHWKAMVLTNVYGVALTIRATLPALTQSGGHVLITSSAAGRRVLPGSLYSATKWAVSAIGEALRQELRARTDGGERIRVTLIAPGMVDTPFFDEGVPEWSLAPQDVAAAVLYALEQPASVDVNEILLRPTGQST